MRTRATLAVRLVTRVTRVTRVDSPKTLNQSGPFKLIKTMLKSLQVLLGLSPVWNRYP